MKTPTSHHQQHGNYPDERSRPAPSKKHADWLAEEAAKHFAALDAVVSPKK